MVYPRKCKLAVMFVVIILNIINIKAGNVNNYQCKPPPTGNTKNMFNFCENVNWPYSNHTNVMEMDALAKQSHDLTLTSLTHCADLILNSQCTAAFRKYICLVNFPHCDISTGAIIKPCRTLVKKKLTPYK